MTAITITGRHFVTGATVTCGGNPCTSVSVTSSVEITCHTPPGTGVADIVVTNPDLSDSGTSGDGLFTYIAAPVVSSLTPNVGNSGTTTAGIAVFGTGFQNGATITFGGAAATAVTFISSTELDCTAPDGAGTVDVVVTNPDAQTSGASGDGLFTYDVVVTSTSPEFGPEAGGTTVRVNGSGFATGATVTFDGVSATGVVLLDAETIECVIPAGTFGPADVLVTNTNAVDSGSSGNGVFQYFWRVDFTTLSDGGTSSAAFASATGLTSFSRSDGSTVQISSSAIISGIAANYACVGSVDGSKRGLWIQGNTKNETGSGGDASPRNFASVWSPGTATTTASYADSPDQSATGCSRINAASGQYGPYGSLSTSARYTWATWQRSKDSTTNGSMQQEWLNSAPGDVAVTLRAASNTWARLVTTKGTATVSILEAVEARDASGGGHGGQTARARDILVDYANLFSGDVAWASIPTGATYRNSDRALGPVPVTGSRLRFYAKLYPLFDSSVQVIEVGTVTASASADWHVLSANLTGSPDLRIKIHDADKKLKVMVAGTELTSTNAITFAAQDALEVIFEVGNNVASYAKWRVNGNSWNDFAISTFTGDATPSQDCAIFYNDLGSNTGVQGQFPCILAELRAYPVDLTTADL